MEPVNRTLNGKKILVTGGAGFIGSNLVGELMEIGCKVTVIDNLSLGRISFIGKFLDEPGFAFIKEDLLNLGAIVKAMEGHDLVFHMAANSDISYGTKFTDVDLKQGAVATYNVLEAMRINGVNEIVFASTSAIYGEPALIPTPEDYGPLLPVSLYGSGKLSSEALISAFSNNFNIRAWMFRFGNIVGRNGTHGVIFDFIKKLTKDPLRLEVLGDGRQSKPYLHVSECVRGMVYGYLNAGERLNVYNLACEGGTPVGAIADLVIAEMGLKSVEVSFTGGPRGWTGDVPFVRLDTGKMEKLGWRATYDSEAAVSLAVKELVGEMAGGAGCRR